MAQGHEARQLLAVLMRSAILEVTLQTSLNAGAGF